MIFMPETPSYLLAQNQGNSAQKSLRFLRGKNYNVDHELAVITESIEKEKSVGSITFKQLCTKGVYAKPMLLMLAIMFFQCYCGINAIYFYLNTIFEQANTGIDPGLSATLVSLVRVSIVIQELI